MPKVYSADNGIWITCDGCQNWFNLSCTNISNSKNYRMCFTVKIVCRKSICLCNVCFSNQPVICVTIFMIRNGLLCFMCECLIKDTLSHISNILAIRIVLMKQSYK